MKNGKPVVLQLCLTLDTGGLERVVVNLANELARSSAVHSQICSLGCTSGDVIPASILGDVRWTELKGKTYFTAWNALKLASLVRREGVDVIHAHGTQPLAYALTTAMLCDVGIVATKHNSYEDLEFFQRRRSFNWMAGKRVSAFTGVSDQATEILQRVFPQAAARCQTLINGTELIRKLPADAECPPKHDKFVLATVCRLAPEKDLVTLLKAFAQVRAKNEKTELWIIGDGSERGNLLQLADNLKLKEHVRFWGFRGRVEQILKCVDLYVNSSWTEGISVSILEAMSAGLPIVATAVGGTPQIVKPFQNGILVLPRDPDALAQAILKLSLDAELCARLGQNSCKLVEENWSLRRMAERYLELYEKALPRTSGKKKEGAAATPRPSVVRRA
ncbi:MAG TPA: glycosyltransferase family 4 protein [Planctomycetota bacterium]|nr:glycosyltransferase family 4 protein [Planctomycetota bacterium]